MNEKREKQKEEEKVNKDRKMRSETIILRPEVPLLERLSTYAASDAYPFHMPGHKRQVKMGITSVPNPFSVDITEIDGFDNLHHAEDILKESMNSAAAVYGADRSWYLVNGSTCGILAAIAAAVKPGEKILMARNSHKSAYHAVVLNQLEPVYLYPEEVPEFQIPGGIEPEQVERALLEHPEIRAVFVTSPTYEGIVSDIQGIAATAHRHGAALIVDEAHGAHLGLSDEAFPADAMRMGADVSVKSLHKTLPSLTQTAILLARHDRVDMAALDHALDIFETSSPSYLLMASIDGCVSLMERRGAEILTSWRQALDEFYEGAAALSNLRVHRQDEPSKLVIDTTQAGITGFELLRRLREENVELEMASLRYAVAMTGAGDTRETLRKFLNALKTVDRAMSAPSAPSKQPASVPPATAPSAQPASAPPASAPPTSAPPASVSPATAPSAQPASAPPTSVLSAQPATAPSASVPPASVPSAQPVSASLPVLPRPVRVLPPKMALHAPSENVPAREAVGRVSACYAWAYPPGVPMLVPGERVPEGFAELWAEWEKSGAKLVTTRGSLRVIRE